MGIVGVIVGEFVSNLSQFAPFFGGFEPAKLFHSAQPIDCGHCGNLFAQSAQDIGNEPGTHVVLQACITVGKLVEEAAVGFVESVQIIEADFAPFQISQGVLERFPMCLANRNALHERGHVGDGGRQRRIPC